MWHWIVESGFPLIQTLGVVGGLLYSGRSFELDRRARQTEVYISLTEAHRDLWKNLAPRPNLRSSPITAGERRFVTLLVVHLSSVHQAVENGIYRSSPEMEQDICELFRLPIPARVLHDILPYQTNSFRSYLESLRHRDDSVPLSTGPRNQPLAE